MNDVMKLAAQEQQTSQIEYDEAFEKLQIENEELRKLIGIAHDETYDDQIDKALVDHEHELIKAQDDYLNNLREEQDAQFACDIEEHKEILQRIYDEKLAEKTEQLEEVIRIQLSDEFEKKYENFAP